MRAMIHGLAGAVHVASGIIGLALMVIGGPAVADEPAGLVLELSGTAEPPVTPFTEVLAGTRLKLGDDTRFAFVHYGTCKALTMIGGEIRIELGRYMIRDGRVESERAQDCPKQITVGDAGTAAAVVIRATGDATLALRPELVLVGPAAGSITSIQVLAGDRLIASLPVTGPQIVWPADRPALTAGIVHRLEFAGPDGGASALEFMADDRKPDKLLIIRLD